MSSKSDTYIIVHKDSVIDVRGINSGAETATLALARYLVKKDKQVIVAGMLRDGDDFYNGVTFCDLGPSYNIWRILDQRRILGPYHLISAGRALPILLSTREEGCISKILISHDRSGNDTGIKPGVLAQHVDKVLCVSNAQRDVIVNDGLRADLTQVIHNGVDLETFKLGATNERNWNSLVFVGAIIPDKGVHVLIDSFVTLKRRFPALTLDLYGSASLWGREPYLDSNEIERSVPGIKFHGKVTQSIIASALAKAGVCVVPSIWFDPFPLSALEAQATGCPVVVFDQGGLREGIKDGETGRLVKETNANALSATLAELLSDQASLAQMSQKAAVWARSYFTWERVAQEVIICCESIAQKKSTQLPQGPATDLKSINL